MKSILLISYLFKKVFDEIFFNDLMSHFKMLPPKLKFIIPFFLISGTSVGHLNTAIEKVTFNVVRNNSIIGHINIEKNTKEDTTTYSINSEVETKFIFNFKANGHEKSIYKNDVLVYSSMYRKLNNKLKLNQYLTLENGDYFFNNKGKTVKLKLNLIRHNLVTLLYYEPKDIQEVYSDKYKQMVKVIFLGNGIYRIELPNGSTSIYHYKKGQCFKVELEGTFYKVELLRKFIKV